MHGGTLVCHLLHVLETVVVPGSNPGKRECFFITKLTWRHHKKNIYAELYAGIWKGLNGNFLPAKLHATAWLFLPYDITALHTSH